MSSRLQIKRQEICKFTFNILFSYLSSFFSLSLCFGNCYVKDDFFLYFCIFFRNLMPHVFLIIFVIFFPLCLFVYLSLSVCISVLVCLPVCFSFSLSIFWSLRPESTFLNILFLYEFLSVCVSVLCIFVLLLVYLIFQPLSEINKTRSKNKKVKSTRHWYENAVVNTRISFLQFQVHLSLERRLV